LGYLHFIIAISLIILTVVVIILFDRNRNKSSSGSPEPAKPRVVKGQSAGNNRPVQRKDLPGGKYIPSYQNDPHAASQIERFLSGAATRNKSLEAKSPSDADEDSAEQILPEEPSRSIPASESDIDNPVQAGAPVQLELGMEDTTQKSVAVNE
jgi:hypothetical protein